MDKHYVIGDAAWERLQDVERDKENSELTARRMRAALKAVGLLAVRVARQPRPLAVLRHDGE